MKIFIETTEYINSLADWSSALVTGVCPDCGEQKALRFYKFKERGHTYCKNCFKRNSFYGYMVGTRTGYLTIKSFGKPTIVSGKKIATFNAVCKCGNELIVSAAHVKSGHTQSCGCYRREMATGETNGNYNPDLTDEDRIGRETYKMQVWGKRVKERDGCCMVCGSVKNLIAHHLNGFKDNPELRFDINNGVTLCRKCHVDFHCNFMGSYRVPCTEQDFNEYVLQV